MEKLRYNHRRGDYVSLLSPGRLLVVDGDRFNYCLSNDDEKDKLVYLVETWLSHVDGDTVFIEEKKGELC